MKKLLIIGLGILLVSSCTKPKKAVYDTTFKINGYVTYSGSYGSGHSGISKTLTGKFSEGETITITMSQDSAKQAYSYYFDANTPTNHSGGTSSLKGITTYTVTL